MQLNPEENAAALNNAARASVASPPVGRPKIAIVVQRFGREVAGGAESHARQIGEVLLPYFDVEILTSTALEERLWSPHFPVGTTTEGGLLVRRFASPPRDRSRRRRTPVQTKFRFILRKWLPRLGALLAPTPSQARIANDMFFLESQGPTMSGLMRFLTENESQYEAIFFFTALFHPGAVGVLTAPSRALLIPTLHDEKAMYRSIYHRVFRAPQRILFNTEAELALSKRLYGEGLARSDVVGVGIEVERVSEALARAARLRHGLTRPYFVYVGRVDASKGCRELFAAFIAFARRSPTPVELLVIGRATMALPQHPSIRYAGFVDDADKIALMQGAHALMMPSRFESLSLALLEGFMLGVPAIVNGNCDVLHDHLVASGAGLEYRGHRAFVHALLQAAQWTPSEREHMARSGARYVQTHYSWPAVTAKLLRAINDVRASHGSPRIDA